MGKVVDTGRSRRGEEEYGSMGKKKVYIHAELIYRDLFNAPSAPHRSKWR